MSIRSARALLAVLADGGAGACFATDPRVVADAARLGILPVLASVAVRHGAAPDLPDAVAAAVGIRRDRLSPTAALLTARFENRQRDRDLVEMERRTLDVLAKHLCVPLKGAALHRHGVWPDPSARPRRDVDLWLPAAGAVDQAAAALLSAGFRQTTNRAFSEAWAGDHHDEPFLLDGLAGSVELHRYPSIQWARGSTVHYQFRRADHGVELTPASVVLHVIIHAQLQDFAYRLRRLPLVPLLDVAYALENGFVTESELRTLAAGTPALMRAVDFHLYCVRRLRTREACGSISLRLRWFMAVVFLGMPHLAALEREVVFAPHALSRPVMELRAGHGLSSWALLACRARFLQLRGREALRRITSPR